MRLNNILFLCFMFLIVGSCSNPKIRERFNLDYTTPDEFMVHKQKELVIPKKFDLVKPQEKSELKEPQQNHNKEQLPKSDQDFLDQVKY